MFAAVPGMATDFGARTMPPGVFGVVDDQYAATFPPANLCLADKALELASFLASSPDFNLSHPHYAWYDFSTGYLFRSESPQEFDQFNDGFEVKGVQFDNGGLGLTYDSDGRLLHFYLQIGHAEIWANHDELNATTCQISEELGLPAEGLFIEHLSIPYYGIVDDDVIVLSDKASGYGLAGCNLFAAYYAKATGQLVAIESRIFLPVVSPSIEVARAEEKALLDAQSGLLSPLHDVSDIKCLGIRVQSVLIPITSYPIPGDSYNNTPSTSRIYRYGYEFDVNVTAKGVFYYHLLVVEDIKKNDCLLLWRQASPVPSGGNGEIPDRPINLNAETDQIMILTWDYTSWMLNSGMIKDFKIYRGPNVDALALIAILPSQNGSAAEMTALNYSDHNASAGANYYYAVEAEGQSGYSMSSFPAGPFSVNSPAGQPSDDWTYIIAIIGILSLIAIVVLVTSRNRRFG